MQFIKIPLLATILVLSFVSCKKDKDEPKIDPNTTINVNTDPSDSLSYVVINLNGMKNTDGKINVGLYNSEATFNDPNQAFRSLTIAVTAGNMIIQLDSLPAGQYAFAVFHDENDNATIDTNFLGIPQEGFAFSNNAQGNFGPPSWSAAQFNLPSKSTITQSISLKFY